MPPNISSYFTSKYFQLTVVHPSPGPIILEHMMLPSNILEAKAAHHLVSSHSVDLSHARVGQQDYFSAGGGGAAGDGHLVVGVVVVCVCVLLSVMVVGVVRLRAAHRRQLREEQEVEMVSLYVLIF